MKIKTLKWRENTDKKSTVVLSCKTSIGLYKINKIEEYRYCVLFNGMWLKRNYNNSVQCKEQAQKHFEDFVKDCLVE